MRPPVLLIQLLSAALLLAGCRGNHQIADPPAPAAHPTLDDFWRGAAHFVVDVHNTGLPMGESDTVLLPDGTLRAYVHASAQSADVSDQCGEPVPFPGCVVLFASIDQGKHFSPVTTDNGLRCLLPCRRCPCDSQIDHVDQQQYPRVVVKQEGDTRRWWMVYEYRAATFLQRSADGLAWSLAEETPLTGIWHDWLMPCSAVERIGPHPFAVPNYDCLVGAPPGLLLAESEQTTELYLFVGLGQNPGSMGCYRGPGDGPAQLLRKCRHNPLFTAAPDYGPLDVTDASANAFFGFRTISSADLLRQGDRHYMLFEGVRGPAAGAAGDTQFALGLARSMTAEIDGPWELYPGNPVLVELPGNVGVGHADLLEIDGEIVLFTSLDGQTRSRLTLQRSRQ